MSKRTLIAILFLVLLLSACVSALPELTPIPTLEEVEETPALADPLETLPATVEGEGEEAADEGEAVDLETALTVYEQNCQACHGEQGKEGTVGPSLYASETIQAMSADEIRDVIANGVEGTAMSAYEDTLSEAEIDGLVALMQSWQGEAATEEVTEEATEEPTEEAAGTESPLTILEVYELNCQSCHGEKGENALVGPDLANSEAVAAMSAGEIEKIIRNGVEGTAMIGFEDSLSSAEIDGLVELIQSWNEDGEAEEAAPTPEPTEEIQEAAETEFDRETALAVYSENCQSCHGEKGENALVGPALAKSEAVAEMSAEEIHDIIANGIEGTAMMSFSDTLSEEEIDQLVMLMQDWQEE